jgi:phosphatidylserine decarboxylase
MSIYNVHQNRIPLSGTVIHKKHYPGKYLVAWNPKSSDENERTSLVIKTQEGLFYKISQIAGFVARRIICNPKAGDVVQQGDELGFILFGSRVDLFLPADAKCLVKLGDKVKANQHILAELD